MSYKFQRGAATLSGSITAEEGLDAGASGVASAGAIAGATTVTATGLADVGSITIDNSATIGCNADSDLITLSNGLVVVAGELQVTTLDIGGTNISATGAELNYSDLTTLGSSEASKVVSADASGDITIVGASANMVWDKSADALEFADNASIEIGTGLDMKLYHDGTNSYIANAVGALKVATETSGIAVTIGHTVSEVTVADNLTVAGNLTVQGSTTSVDSTTINISSSFTFEGPADDHETILTCGTPTQDNTLTLPQFSGSAEGVYHIPVLADATTAASALVTAAEFALLDGGSTVGNVSLADADGFMHNDNGTMKQTQVVKIAELAFSKVSGDATIAAGGALTIAANAVEGTMLDANVADDSTLELISNELRIKDNGVTLAKMAGLADGTFILGSAGGDPAAVSMSGDATMNNAGLLTIAATAIEGSMLNDNCISGQADFGSVADNIANTDEFLISDGGVLKRLDASVLKTFFQTGVIADTANEAEGFRYADYSVTSSYNYDVASRSGIHVPSGSNSAQQYSASALVNVHLSASAGDWANGMIVTIKAPSNASDFPLTIYASGSLEKIDGESSIILESDNASVSLLRAFSKDWVIV